MNTHKSLIILIFAFCINMVQAQEKDNSQYIPLTVWIPNNIEMPVASKKNLADKLNQMIVAGGIGMGLNENSRFIVTANVTTISKDITATAPPMQAYTLNVTFYIGDGIDGKAFSSHAITIKGVGENEVKAYTQALRSIKTNNPDFLSFITKGKEKIIDYYNAQCDVIIREAKSAAGMHQFDQALWMLSSIPDAATTCREKALIELAATYQAKIDFECTTKLAAANNIWNAGQSWDAAEEAGAILASINPASACFKDAKTLADKISKRINEVDKREWNVIYEQTVGLEKDRIEAARQIGVAYGNNQPQNVTYRSFW